MAALRNLLSGITVPATESGVSFLNFVLGSRVSLTMHVLDVDLTAVLTADTLRPVLSDPASRAALFPHLPPGAPHTQAELDATVRSPQFRQSVQALAFALRSGQLATILTSMGTLCCQILDGHASSFVNHE